MIRRYAGDDPRQIVVIGELEAVPRRRLGRRRPRSAAPGAGPDAVEVTRATVIATDPLAEDGAHEWLRKAVEARDATVGDALVAAQPGDPRSPARRRATRTWPRSARRRRWRPASATGRASRSRTATGRRRASCRRRRRSARHLLSPQQRLAALLSGRDVALACEELDAARPARLRPGPRARGRAPARGSRSIPRWPSSRAGARPTTSPAGSTSWLGTASRSAAAAAAALQGGLQPEQTEAVEAALEAARGGPAGAGGGAVKCEASVNGGRG